MEEKEKKYEFNYILDSNMDESTLETPSKEIEQIIEQNGGVIIERTLPNKKRLAYKIKNNFVGFFGNVVFSTKNENTISGIEKDFNFKKGIIRFLITKLAKKEKDLKLLSPRLRSKRAAPANDVIKTDNRTEDLVEEKKPAEPATPSSKIKLEDLDQKLEEILGK